MTTDFRSIEIGELADDRIVEERQVYDQETGPSVELPVDEGRWTGVNEIRAEIFLPQDAAGTIECEITLDTRAPGFDFNNGYWHKALVSPRGGNIWEGWGVVSVIQITEMIAAIEFDDLPARGMVGARRRRRVAQPHDSAYEATAPDSKRRR